jgi:hypothetical protein
MHILILGAIGHGWLIFDLPEADTLLKFRMQSSA